MESIKISNPVDKDKIRHSLIRLVLSHSTEILWTMKTELILCRTFIRPVLTYAAEIWILTKKTKKNNKKISDPFEVSVVRLLQQTKQHPDIYIQYKEQYQHKIHNLLKEPCTGTASPGFSRVVRRNKGCNPFD
ncbi:hypothetical protein CDAR_410431 [Caerostris darwini]|uniref:Uncharacterized protein n=1 Tax=Caerostris darwini TaxID=1538125 RepID=A0AAV4MX49_9ARAC|nr:hypothetical protein CDAR_410431 [Caerostris darwini]